MSFWMRTLPSKTANRARPDNRQVNAPAQGGAYKLLNHADS
jgi:hypothetical protein